MMTREKDERMRRMREKRQAGPQREVEESLEDDDVRPWTSGGMGSGDEGKAVEKSHNRMRPVPVRSVQVAGKHPGRWVIW